MEFNKLSDGAKSAISMIFNAPDELSIQQVRRAVRNEYGRAVERELRTALCPGTETEGDTPNTGE